MKSAFSLAAVLLWSVSTVAVAADAKPAAKVDLARGSQVATQVCAACHAADGNSPAAANPRLAGQHPEYLARHLASFKENKAR